MFNAEKLNAIAKPRSEESIKRAEQRKKEANILMRVSSRFLIRIFRKNKYCQVIGPQKNARGL